nr:hypothetical protein CFP56_22013 [Quercus suber]
MTALTFGMARGMDLQARRQSKIPLVKDQASHATSHINVVELPRGTEVRQSAVIRTKISPKLADEVTSFGSLDCSANERVGISGRDELRLEGGSALLGHKWYDIQDHREKKASNGGHGVARKDRTPKRRSADARRKPPQKSGDVRERARETGRQGSEWVVLDVDFAEQTRATKGVFPIAERMGIGGMFMARGEKVLNRCADESVADQLFSFPQGSYGVWRAMGGSIGGAEFADGSEDRVGLALRFAGGAGVTASRSAETEEAKNEE